jgi:hypothetical protein
MTGPDIKFHPISCKKRENYTKKDGTFGYVKMPDAIPCTCLSRRFTDML